MLTNKPWTVSNKLKANNVLIIFLLKIIISAILELFNITINVHYVELLLLDPNE